MTDKIIKSTLNEAAKLQLDISDILADKKKSSKRRRDPKYLKIKNILVQRIFSGEYQFGSYLPSESQLMKEFGVSRVTLRLAIELLQEMDIISSRQGKGHFIKGMLVRRDLCRLQGFGEIMAPLGVNAHSKLLSVEKVLVPQKVSEALQLKSKNKVIKIMRLRFAADIVMSMDVSYFPLDIGETLIEQNLEQNDVFFLLENVLGMELGFADIVIDLVRPMDCVAKHLNISSQESVFRLERITHNLDGRPIEFEYIYGHPQKHQFNLRVPRW